jgi:LPXTG-motif cell wall-anchored protein
MSPRFSRSRHVGLLLYFTVSTYFTVSIGLSTPAIAHTVKAAEDVAVTFHIEPNHNPRSGQPAQAWFVLTQSGGKLIPFQHCNCQLAVYDQAMPQTALLMPMLKPIAAEQYREIPGADIVFPKPGIYSLEFSGKPRSEGAFKPFTLTYTVTVVAGTGMPPTASPSPQGSPLQIPGATPQPTSKSAGSAAFSILPLAGIAILAGVAGWIGWRKIKR